MKTQQNDLVGISNYLYYIMKTSTFIDLVVAGKENINNINTYIDHWHKYSSYIKEPLATYLGFTKDEYATWVMFPSYIDEVVKDRTTV